MVRSPVESALGWCLVRSWGAEVGSPRSRLQQASLSSEFAQLQNLPLASSGRFFPPTAFLLIFLHHWIHLLLPPVLPSTPAPQPPPPTGTVADKQAQPSLEPANTRSPVCCCSAAARVETPCLLKDSGKVNLERQTTQEERFASQPY